MKETLFSNRWWLSIARSIRNRIVKAQHPDDNQDDLTKTRFEWKFIT